MRHDEKLLPQMLAILESGPIDFGGILDGKGAGAPSKISRRGMKKPLTGSAMSASHAAGSRHVTGGGIGGWDAALSIFYSKPAAAARKSLIFRRRFWILA